MGRLSGEALENCFVLLLFFIFDIPNYGDPPVIWSSSFALHSSTGSRDILG
jgi:hypothetical protein